VRESREFLSDSMVGHGELAEREGEEGGEKKGAGWLAIEEGAEGRFCMGRRVTQGGVRRRRR
jgi:hypothetical protein